MDPTHNHNHNECGKYLKKNFFQKVKCSLLSFAKAKIYQPYFTVIRVKQFGLIWPDLRARCLRFLEMIIYQNNKQNVNRSVLGWDCDDWYLIFTIYIIWEGFTSYDPKQSTKQDFKIQYLRQIKCICYRKVGYLSDSECSILSDILIIIVSNNILLMSHSTYDMGGLPRKYHGNLINIHHHQ